MGRIGELHETKGELTIEWKIKGFSSLSKVLNTQYDSPKFRFSATSWEIWIYPNGDETSGWISLYLAKTSTGPPITVDFTLAIKTVNSKVVVYEQETYTFRKTNFGRGTSEAISRSEVAEKKSEIIPSDVLTIICTLKNSEQNADIGASPNDILLEKKYSITDRSLMTEIGKLSEASGDVKVEWEIKDFFSLSQEIDKHYHSPKFYFSGTSWQIQISPKSEVDDASGDWIGLYLTRMANGHLVEVTFSLRFKTVDEQQNPCIRSTNDFIGKGNAWGNPKFISRSMLMERKSQMIPANVLTVICTLKNNESNNVTGSLFGRQQGIIDNLKEIYEQGRRADCTLKVEGENIQAHRIILETRSPVFAAMFSHDTKENQTGEISIDDMEKSSMESILEYMYCGDFPNITMENAVSVYAAADKYDVTGVKEMCLDFITSELSIDWVCDVIKFSDIYQVEEIGNQAREFFRKNARKLLKTDKWKRFAKENHDIGVELLGSLVLELLPE